MPSVERCLNCDAEISGAYCSACGQVADIRIPSVAAMLQEGFGSVFSYDSRLWRTLRTLGTRPGQLTVDFLEGRRVRYLGPLQLFVWLETITFAAHRVFFDNTAKAGDAKTRELLLLGCLLTIVLTIVYAPKRRKFVEHLICTSHLWAFLMLLLLVLYCTMPPVGLVFPHLMIGRITTVVSALGTMIYTGIALKVVYRDTLPVTVLKTMLIIGATVSADIFLANRVFHGSILF